MYSPYVSWYQVPKGYSKPKPLSEMFTIVNKTIFGNMQYFPVAALFVSCDCDIQKKLMTDTKFDSHCDNNVALDLSVKSLIKNEPSQPSGYNNNYSDIDGIHWQELHNSNNILSDDNKENCLSALPPGEHSKVQNIKSSGDDAMASTKTSSPKKEHSGGYSKIKKTNLKVVKRIEKKELHKKMVKLRRRWLIKALSAINIDRTIISSVMNSVKQQLLLFSKKRKKLHPCQTEKKSVPCQTTWEIEPLASRSPSLVTRDPSFTSNDNPISPEGPKVTQEILCSNYDPLLSNNNMLKIVQKANLNNSSSDAFPDCSRLNKRSAGRPKENFPEISSVVKQKEMSSQDFSVLMDLDNFSTDKLLDLLSVEYDVFGNVPKELDNFELYFPMPNCGVSQADDDQEDLMLKQGDDSKPALGRSPSSTSPTGELKDTLSSKPSEQLSNLEASVELTQEYFPSTYESPVLHKDDSMGGPVKSRENDENNNFLCIPSKKQLDAEPEKVVKTNQDKNFVEKVDCPITDLVDQKHLPPKTPKKRRGGGRGGTVGNNKTNKRLKSGNNLVKNLREHPFKTNKKLQQTLRPKKREGRTPKTSIRVTRASSQRQRALCFCEEKDSTSLKKIVDQENILNHNKLLDSEKSEAHGKYGNSPNNNNAPSLKIKIPLLNLTSFPSQTDDIVGKIIKESTAKTVHPPTTILKTRNPHFTKQKTKAQSKPSSIDFTFLPDYVPVLLKNSCPNLTPIHEPVYNFPSQTIGVTVPIAEKRRPPVGKAKNIPPESKRLIRDPRLRHRKRKESQGDEEEAEPKKRAVHADNEENVYPNVSVSKEDLEKNTFLITEILRDAISYGICASYGIALFDSNVLHQCPEMDSTMNHPYNQRFVNNEHKQTD